MVQLHVDHVSTSYNDKSRFQLEILLHVEMDQFMKRYYTFFCLNRDQIANLGNSSYFLKPILDCVKLGQLLEAPNFYIV